MPTSIFFPLPKNCLHGSKQFSSSFGCTLPFLNYLHGSKLEHYTQ
ncbi:MULTISPECIES: hypothetical protein [unclassified Gilliamella]|nr:MULTISPECIES: hypothetical protein [unclassified Gilliamella]